MRSRPAAPRAIDAKLFMLITLHFVLPFSIIHLCIELTDLESCRTEPLERYALPTAYVMMVASQWVELPTARQTRRKTAKMCRLDRIRVPLKFVGRPDDYRYSFADI
jgi:hypothetical protein